MRLFRRFTASYRLTHSRILGYRYAEGPNLRKHHSSKARGLTIEGEIYPTWFVRRPLSESIHQLTGHVIGPSRVRYIRRSEQPEPPPSIG